MKPVAHTTSVIGGAKTDRRSKDKDEAPIQTRDARPTVFDAPQSEDQGTRKGRGDADPLLEALQRNYCRRKPPEPSYGISHDPTGQSWRHGK